MRRSPGRAARPIDQRVNDRHQPPHHLANDRSARSAVGARLGVLRYVGSSSRKARCIPFVQRPDPGPALVRVRQHDHTASTADCPERGRRRSAWAQPRASPPRAQRQTTPGNPSTTIHRMAPAGGKPQSSLPIRPRRDGTQMPTSRRSNNTASRKVPTWSRNHRISRVSNDLVSLTSPTNHCRIPAKTASFLPNRSLGEAGPSRVIASLSPPTLAALIERHRHHRQQLTVADIPHQSKRTHADCVKPPRDTASSSDLYSQLSAEPHPNYIVKTQCACSTTRHSTNPLILAASGRRRSAQTQARALQRKHSSPRRRLARATVHTGTATADSRSLTRTTQSKPHTARAAYSYQRAPARMLAVPSSALRLGCTQLRRSRRTSDTRSA